MNIIEKNLISYNEEASKHMLPSWDELPEINLYMDQVLILMNKYLEIYNKYSGAEKLITPSIINNYVKLKVIPSPQKKKYAKTHLAYLLMVCILKQCLSIAAIKKIIPSDLSEEALKKLYETFRTDESEILKSNINKLQENISAETALVFALKANVFKTFTDILTSEPEEKG